MPRGGVEEGGTAQHLQHAKHLTPSLSELNPIHEFVFIAFV